MVLRLTAVAVPDPFRVLEALVLLTALVGFQGLIWRRNLFLRALALDVMSTGAVALFVLVAARSGLRTPIVDRAELGVTAQGVIAWADAIPQAVILTAIVIGLSIQALLLVAIARLSRLDPLLDTGSFERLLLESSAAASPRGRS
jgi:multicomponent Na+:H+ antiporter subunit C